MDKNNLIFFCSKCEGMTIVTYKYEKKGSKIDLIIKCHCLKDREIISYTIENFLNNNLVSVPRLICKFHKTQFTNWCINCNINICDKCLSNHNSHKLVQLSSILIDKKDITSLENKIIYFQEKLLAKQKKVEEIENFNNEEEKEFLLNFQNYKDINSKEIEFVTKLKDLYLFLLKSNMICYQIIRNLRFIISQLSSYNDNLDKKLIEKDDIVDIYYIVFNPLEYLLLPNNDQEEIDKKTENMINSLALEKSLPNSNEMLPEANENYKLNNLDIQNLAETMKLDKKLFLFRSLKDINENNTYNNHNNNIENKTFNDDYNDNNNNKINSNNNNFANYNNSNFEKNNNIVFNSHNDNIFNNNIFNNNIIFDNKNNNSFNNDNIFNNNKIDNNNFNIPNNNNISKSLPLNNNDSDFFSYKNENPSNPQQKNNNPICFDRIKNGEYHEEKCKLEYPNGDIYEGSIREGLRHGEGKLTNNNKSNCYEGFLAYDKKNGKCVEKIGNDKNGVHDGKCTIIYDNKDKFEGNLKDGKKDGYGVYTYHEGHKTYKGGFKNNLYEGEGEITSDNGYYFKGQFLGGLRHGDKCIEKKEGIRKYEGSFRRGKMNGKGVYYWYSGENKGDIYEGEFVDDIIEGKGVYHYNYGTQYIGNFLRGLKHGKGKEIYIDGSYFEGEFKEGKKHGEGTFVDAEGNQFIGMYKDGKENGRGKIIYYNDETLEGTWFNGLKQGEFVFKDCYGNSSKRKYEKDQLI